jgi:hypothetical protein
MKSIPLPIIMSQEVAQKETENPNTLFHIYLDNPKSCKYKAIPFKAPTNVDIPHKCGYSFPFKQNPLYFQEHNISLCPIQQITMKTTFKTLLNLHHLP